VNRDAGNDARPEVDDASRKRAILVLIVTVVLGIAAWLMLGRAADSGIDRLATIDRVRAGCDSLLTTARNQNDSARIARTPLSDTVDAQSDKAIRTCGDLGASKQ
jgi:hypothetical protein